VLTAIAVVSLVGAAVLGTVALTRDEAAVTLKPEPAVASTQEIQQPTASTTTEATSESGGVSGDPTGDADGGNGSGIDPVLVQSLGPRASALPEPVVPRPAGLDISSLPSVSRYPVRSIGLEPDGQMEIPDETEIGWYRYGARPGQPGTTVLAAHVSWNRTTGPFARLGDVEPGDLVTVRLEDWTSRTYQVVERAIYGKLELPADRLWNRTGPETLALITCGGDYDPDARRYSENIVIFAVPVT
jgi:hypothetical protein